MNWYNPYFTNHVHSSLIREQQVPISPTQDSVPRISPGSIQHQVPKVKQQIKRNIPMNWYNPYFTNHVHSSLIREQQVPISPTQDSVPRISPGSIQQQPFPPFPPFPQTSSGKVSRPVEPPLHTEDSVDGRI